MYNFTTELVDAQHTLNYSIDKIRLYNTASWPDLYLTVRVEEGVGESLLQTTLTGFTTKYSYVPTASVVIDSIFMISNGSAFQLILTNTSVYSVSIPVFILATVVHSYAIYFVPLSFTAGQSGQILVFGYYITSISKGVIFIYS
jgi:hypothetical protein